MSIEALTNGDSVHPNGHAAEQTSGAPIADLSKNDNEKPWLVQKFGGTSVGKVPKEIAENIIKTRLKNHRIAVVCSARSSDTKADGTTNRLLRAAKEAEILNSERCREAVTAIRDDHIASALTLIRSSAIVERVVADIEDECRDLISFLAAAQKVQEVSPRTLDRVVSKGENLSCRIMAALLQDIGVDAEFVNLADILSPKESQGMLDQDFYEQLTQRLGQKIKACEGKVPVITGYFGTIQGGLLKKIGRGYTDLCAALVAIGIGAEELQIWKEVDGVFTANPHKVPTARLLPAISPAEAAELSFYGSEVIHPFTMEQVIRARIPIRIRNVMNLRNKGTVIVPDPLPPSTPDNVSQGSATPDTPSSKYFRSRSSTLNGGFRPKRPTAVTIKHRILVLNVHSNKRSLSHGFFANIFGTLDRWRLSVDLISTSEVHVSMALHSESALVSGGGEHEKEIVDADLRGAVEELAQYGTVDIRDQMAILSLVGKQMKNMPGIAGKMFSTLGENHVNIEMISQGASEINISCVIEERDADRAINILHTNLFTFLD